MTASEEAPTRIGRYRWVICALLFFALTINYVDRQVLGVLKPYLETELGWSETDYADIVFWFQAAYALSLLCFGRVMDWIGTRWGLAVAITVWSLAAVFHAGARTAIQFSVVRFVLGLGEAGVFPAAVKTVSEWFPKKERALATGIFNAGSNVGALVTPILVPLIVISLGWQWAFIITGASGFVLLAVWLIVYRRPHEHPRLGAAERAHIESDPADPPGKVGWGVVIRKRETWAFLLGKFITDPVWWLFLFWLPDFFAKTYDLNILTFGPPLVIVYLLADVGSVGGGWLSSRLIKNGWSINRSRKTTMLICALAVTPISIAVFAHSLPIAVALIGLAAAAHQGWSANMYTLVSDVFPRRAVATVVGFGAAGGAVGGMFISKFAGWTLETTGSYVPLLAFAGGAYLLALLVIHLLTPRLEPVTLPPEPA
ncbi:MAG: MFS transporter [Brevundimonas sp.]|uniref:MFS transporter n=1 Tax=Brevundimonas sp. Leaf363 TaxID=1736353 RepID=UPI0006F1D558|nr:MFS transporter [Brevundimonas sp. Leaf363]KQS53916.1 hexuronate transporter [Brevundimonas sp. Leaf363]RZJ98561.1 MAG: MFS transporter [Brevundimonas sp.]